MFHRFCGAFFGDMNPKWTDTESITAGTFRWEAISLTNPKYSPLAVMILPSRSFVVLGIAYKSSFWQAERCHETREHFFWPALSIDLDLLQVDQVDSLHEIYYHTTHFLFLFKKKIKFIRTNQINIKLMLCTLLVRIPIFLAEFGLKAF